MDIIALATPAKTSQHTFGVCKGFGFRLNCNWGLGGKGGWGCGQVGGGVRGLCTLRESNLALNLQGSSHFPSLPAKGLRYYMLYSYMDPLGLGTGTERSARNKRCRRGRSA